MMGDGYAIKGLITLALDKRCLVPDTGRIIEVPNLGGLHCRYERAAVKALPQANYRHRAVVSKEASKTWGQWWNSVDQDLSGGKA